MFTGSTTVLQTFLYILHSLYVSLQLVAEKCLQVEQNKLAIKLQIVHASLKSEGVIISVRWDLYRLIFTRVAAIANSE